MPLLMRGHEKKSVDSYTRSDLRVALQRAFIFASPHVRGCRRAILVQEPTIPGYRPTHTLCTRPTHALCAVLWVLTGSRVLLPGGHFENAMLALNLPPKTPPAVPNLALLSPSSGDAQAAGASAV
eukprot:1751815-Rhodomonas_salina.3